ncbi:uncharacterized protein [Argopecten irradians]|uniref:uncharacterized protein n=1 Tax=Argopecten irradians TaxID=31199 RepID=UPI003710ABDD
MAESREPEILDLLHQENDPLHQGNAQVEGIDKRRHKLTAKAQEQFNLTVQNYYSKLFPLRQELDELILMLGDDSDDKYKTLPALHNAYGRYLKISFELKSYLTRINSEEADIELRKHGVIFKTVTEEVEKAATLFHKQNVVTQENARFDDEESIPESHKSSASVVLARQRAKVEAARTNKQFIWQESNLLKEKAHLEAESILKSAEITVALKNLKAEQEDQVAKVEYQAILEEFEETDPVKPKNVYQQTSNYNIGKTPMRSPKETPPRRKLPQLPVSTPQMLNEKHDAIMAKLSSTHRVRLNPQVTPFIPQSRNRCKTSFPAEDSEIPKTPRQNTSEIVSQHQPISNLILSPPVHYSTPASPQGLPKLEPQVLPNPQDGTVQLSKYLMKRELITGRLLQFSDKPEAYLSWKTPLGML